MFESMYRMSDGEREIWNEQQRDAAPTVVTLRTSRSRRARKERKLTCGHTIKVGQWYDEWVGVVDGEFTVDHHCENCIRELHEPSDEELEQWARDNEAEYVDVMREGYGTGDS